MKSPRLQALRRVALYASVGIVVYVVALMICFPYNRIKDLAVAMAAQAGYDAEIVSAGPAFPFGVSFEDLRIRSRAPTATGKPIEFRFDSARVPFLPIALSGGKAFDVTLVGMGGRIDLAADTRKGGPMHYEVRADDLNLAQVPGVRELWNLPLTGVLQLKMRLDSKTDRFAESNGEIEFKCVTCTIGDGKAAVKFGGGNPFLAAGLTLPRVRLGDFGGRVLVEKGTAKAQGVAIKSADAELTLEGDVVLRDPVGNSMVNAYLRFKLGETLLKNAPGIASVLQVAGSPGLRPDGFYGLRFSGLASALVVELSPTSPVSPAGLGRPGSSRTPVVPSNAPTRAVTPSPPARPSSVVAPMTPPDSEPPPPAPSAPAPPPPPPPPAAPASAPPPPVAAAEEYPPPPPPATPPSELGTEIMPVVPVRSSPIGEVGRGRGRNPAAAPAGTTSDPGPESPTSLTNLGGAPGGVAPGASPASPSSPGASPGSPPSAAEPSGFPDGQPVAVPPE